jgi:heptosyltransferase-3
MKLSKSAPRLDPKKILVVQLRRIGDCVLCTPALRALKEQYPNAQIDFLAEYPAEETLRSHPAIRKLWVAPMRGLAGFVELARNLRRERYDFVIDFFSNPRSAQFVFFTGAKVRAGLKRRGRSWAYTHHFIEEENDHASYAVDLRLDMLRLLGISAGSRALDIYSDHDDREAQAKATHLLDSMTGVVVAVATGSANAAKRYPADLTAQTIELLRASHMEVVLTSGPGEGEFAKRILDKLPRPVPHYADARVPELAALYRHCALYVGPDSGPKHVAVACGIPTVTIFGPGNPDNWNDKENPKNVVLSAGCSFRPKCDELECARLGHIATITPREVLGAALKLVLG